MKLAGTLIWTDGSDLVKGHETYFLQEVIVGQSIWRIGDTVKYTVLNIISDKTIQLTTNYSEEQAAGVRGFADNFDASTFESFWSDVINGGDNSVPSQYDFETILDYIKCNDDTTQGESALRNIGGDFEIVSRIQATVTDKSFGLKVKGLGEIFDDFDRADTVYKFLSGVGLGNNWYHGRTDGNGAGQGDNNHYIKNNQVLNPALSPHGFSTYKTQLSSTDQYIEATFIVPNYFDPGNLGLSLRLAGLGEDSYGYYMRYENSPQTIKFYRKDAGGDTQIGSTISKDLENTTKRVRFECETVTGDVHLRVFLDGVQESTDRVDSSGSKILTGNYCAIYSFTDEGEDRAVKLDTFSAGALSFASKNISLEYISGNLKAFYDSGSGQVEHASISISGYEDKWIRILKAGNIVSFYSKSVENPDTPWIQIGTDLSAAWLGTWYNLNFDNGLNQIFHYVYFKADSGFLGYVEDGYIEDVTNPTTKFPNLYWLISPITIALNYMDDAYRILKRLINLATSEGKHLTNIGKDLDVERYRHVDKILKIRAFNSMEAHTRRGTIEPFELEGSNFYKIRTKVLSAIGGLFAQVITGVNFTDDFDRADTTPTGDGGDGLGDDWIHGEDLSIGIATTGTTTTILKDSGATFITDGVVANDWLTNKTVPGSAFIQTVDSEIQLTLSTAITGQASGDSYVVKRDAGFHIENNKCIEKSGSGGNGFAFYKKALRSTQQLIEVDIAFPSGAPLPGNFELHLRCSGKILSALSDYHIRYEGEFGYWDFYRRDSGVDTSIGSTNTNKITSVTKTIRFEVEDVSGDVELRLYINGVLDHSETDSSGGSELTTGDYCAMYIQSNAATADSYGFDNFKAGSLIGYNATPSIPDEYWRAINNSEAEEMGPIIKLSTPAIMLSPWVRHMLVYDEDEQVTDDEENSQTKIEYITLNNLTSETMDALNNKVYIEFIYNDPDYDMFCFKSYEDWLVASTNQITDYAIAVAEGIPSSSNEGKYFIKPLLDSGIFGFVYMNDVSWTEKSYLYHTKRHKLAEILDKFIPAHTIAFMDGYRKYDILSNGIATVGTTTTVLIDTGASFVNLGVQVDDWARNITTGGRARIQSIDSETQITLKSAISGQTDGDSYIVATAAAYGIEKVGDGLTFTNFTIDPPNAILDKATYFELVDGYENQQITITSEAIELITVDKNWFLDVVYWMKNKTGNYFIMEVRQATTEGGLTSADWREFKNNSSLRESDGTLEDWHQFQVKFMVKESTDIIIENFIYKQALEYLNAFFE